MEHGRRQFASSVHFWGAGWLRGTGHGDNLPEVQGSALHPHPEPGFGRKESPFKGFRMAHGKIKRLNND